MKPPGPRRTPAALQRQRQRQRQQKDRLKDGLFSWIGGVTDGTRTHDNQNHNLGLYQLSYSHRKLSIIACENGFI